MIKFFLISGVVYGVVIKGYGLTHSLGPFASILFKLLIFYLFSRFIAVGGSFVPLGLKLFVCWPRLRNPDP